MAQKSIDKDVLENEGKAYGRQAMWNVIREKTTFTLKDICGASGREKSSIKTYVKSLINAKIVEEISEKHVNQPTVFRLIHDAGHIAPRIKADGTPIVSSREQMWLAMKMLNTFTYENLAIHASTDECLVNASDAGDYCKHLLKAGYLRVVQKSTYNSKAVYSLNQNMNTGRFAPKVQRTKVVFDTNLNKIMWHGVQE